MCHNSIISLLNLDLPTSTTLFIIRMLFKDPYFVLRASFCVTSPLHLQDTQTHIASLQKSCRYAVIQTVEQCTLQKCSLGIESLRRL